MTVKTSGEAWAAMWTAAEKYRETPLCSMHAPTDQFSWCPECMADEDASEALSDAMLAHTKAEVAEALSSTRAQLAEVTRVATEALDGWEDCIAYKCEHLAEKHHDRADIANLRNLLSQQHGADHG